MLFILIYSWLWGAPTMVRAELPASAQATPSTQATPSAQTAQGQRTQTAQLPEGLATPCNSAAASEKAVQEAAAQKAIAPECASQVQRVLEKCRLDVTVTPEEAATLADTNAQGRANGAQVAVAQYTLRRDKMQMQAELCQKEFDPFVQTCKSAEEKLRTALEAQSDPIPVQHSKENQLRVTRRTRELVSSFAENTFRCDLNQARIYEAALADAAANRDASSDKLTGENSAKSVRTEKVAGDQADGAPTLPPAEGSGPSTTTSATATAASSAEPSSTAAAPALAAPGAAPPAESRALAGSVSQRMGAAIVIKGGESIAESALPTVIRAGGAVVSKAAGPAGLLVGGPSDPPSMLVTGAGVAAELAGVSFSTVAAGGMFGAVVLYSTPAMPTCDGVMDPVQAYQRNCALTTPAGARSLNSAIQTLGHD